MQANAVRGNLRRRAIDGLDVRLDHPEEAVERVVLKQPRALHREIGATGAVHDVARPRTPTLSPEAAQAPRHVGGESHAWLLTIVADIDARVQLLADDRPDGGVDLSPELGLVDGLTALFPAQQLSEPWGPRKAPDVRDEHARFTPF